MAMPHALTLLAATCLLTTLGCRTPKPMPAATAPPAGGGILLLPVLPARPDLASAAAELTQALRQELATRHGSRLVYAGDLGPVAAALETGNLRRDGQIAVSEIATLARVAGCASALLVGLVDADSYVPQNLTGHAVLVDSTSAAIAAERLVALDLGTPETADSYHRYLKAVRSFRVANLESETADRLHTAQLSPAVFRRFAAHSIVTSLYGDKPRPAKGE